MESRENRKLKRKHLIYYLRIFRTGTHELIGHLVDLTTEGIMVISEEKPVDQQTYALTMDLPQEISGHGTIDFTAQCVWVNNATNPDFYDSGFRLINVSDENIKIIKELVQLFCFESEKK